MLLAMLAPVVAIAANLDGDAGDETIALDKDGTLTAGLAITQVPFDIDGQPREGTRLAVVTLAGNRRAVYMISRTDGDDKPPARHRLWVYEKGTLRLVYNGIWDLEPIKFSKHGTGRVLESGVGACLRARTEHDELVNTVRKHIVLLRFDRAGLMLVEQRRPSNETQDCGELELRV